MWGCGPFGSSRKQWIDGISQLLQEPAAHDFSKLIIGAEFAASACFTTLELCYTA
jgi:hypothetical protein